ncbi:hypothetical protein COV20_04205 [Candidatus Woesearchaeota archaeon CG10_big_fil_rev_8_21_14_0_10_45_16]|nr:MAG: hypothetical protein COV20_04205 [Candidatus Woesearchaeota archaeon CG10_big_fil_rev_8_21_14_0_10_45_16]
MDIQPGQVARYIAEHDQILDPHGTRVPKIPLTPYFIEQPFLEEVAVMVGAFTRLHEHVAQKYGTFREILGYEEYLDRLLQGSPTFALNTALTRLDVFPTDEGLKVVEVNCQSPGGNEDSAALETLFKKHFAIEGEQLPDRIGTALDAIVGCYHEQISLKGGAEIDKPSIALIEKRKDISSLMGRFAVFIDRARELGHPCEIAAPEDLTFHGKEVRLDGKAVDIIYNRLITDEIAHEPKVGGYDFARRLNDSEAAVVLPFSAKRADSKRMLTFLSDPRYRSLFPTELQKDLHITSKYIPETVILATPDDADGLIRRLKREQDGWVLKAANSVASQAVYLGSDMTPADWQLAIDRAVGKDWVAQRRIPLPRMPVTFYDQRTKSQRTTQMVYNVCPFTFGGKFTGAFYVRASQDNLTSAKSGTAYTILPCFEKRKD